MIRLRTLGSIDLRDDAGANLSGVLRQPKRFGLFVYLALARPRGFHRRDALLPLFWPELDDARARASLRQAIYTLRRQLPDGVLANRGDGEVGLVPDSLWCDVHELEAAVEEGEPERVVDLYRGELLPAFHVPDAAPELAYWLDGERERLRELGRGAFEAAVAAAEARGDVRRACRVAALASELSPLDEDAVRRHLDLMARTGDRAGAMQLFEQWRRRLREELEIEPSPETLRLVGTIRTSASRSNGERGEDRPGIAPREAAEPDEPGTPGAATPAPASAPLEPAPSAVAPSTERGGRTKVVMAMAVLLLGLAAVLVPGSPLRSAWLEEEPRPAEDRLVVMPFTYRGGSESAYLSEGLVHLFSVGLDGGEFRSVDPSVVIGRVAGGADGALDPGSAAAIASEMDAQYYVVGGAVEAGGRLQVSASLYETRGHRLVGQASAVGATSGVLELVEQVAAELLTARTGTRSRVTRLAAITTPSLIAFKAYLEGERLLSQGHFAEAVEAFEEAVLVDTLFALAHFRKSLAASWAFRGDLATLAAERAVAHADRLPERERRILVAHEAYRQGDAARALEGLRELSRTYPADPEVWYRLGEVLMHFGPLHGWPITEARDPFQRIAELTPAHAEAVNYHLAQIEAAAERNQAALRYARRALEVAPEGARAPQLRALVTVLSGGAWAPVLNDLRSADDFTLLSTTYNMAVYVSRPRLSRSVAALLVEPERSPETRALGHLLLAELDLALGQWDRARARLDSLALLDAAQAQEALAMLSLAPGADLDEEAMVGLVRDLVREPTGPRLIELPARLESPPRFHALTRPYVRSLLAAHLGDEAVVAEATQRLEEHAEAPEVGAELAEDARFILAMRGGRQDLPTRPDLAAVSAEASVVSPMFARSHRRYLQARLLERQGQPREALRWYESLSRFTVHDLPWAVPALLDRARILEALGEPGAAPLYRRFAELWQDADDQSLRQLALARARALEAN